MLNDHFLKLNIPVVTDSRWQRCFLYGYTCMGVTFKKKSGRGDGIGQVDKRGRVKICV